MEKNWDLTELDQEKLASTDWEILSDSRKVSFSQMIQMWVITNISAEMTTH